MSTAGAQARLVIRPGELAHLPAVVELYAHHVRHGTGTFETEPPSLAEITQRWEAVRRHRLPFLVGECGSALAGFAYAGPFRPRPAYRYTVEDSVYIHPDFQRRGMGRALLSELIEQCTALDLRQMVALVGDSGNAASIGLHEALGFERVGRLPAAGYKFERWLDVVILQRTLGRGGATAPEGDGWERRA